MVCQFPGRDIGGKKICKKQAKIDANISLILHENMSSICHDTECD